MTDIFVYALAISTVFFLFKFLEMKMLPDEDKKPLKVVMKETFVVYFASIVGIYMYAQFDNQEITPSYHLFLFFIGYFW